MSSAVVAAVTDDATPAAADPAVPATIEPPPPPAGEIFKELRSIGRLVRLTYAPHVYEGILSFVTHTTIVMMNATMVGVEPLTVLPYVTMNRRKIRNVEFQKFYDVHEQSEMPREQLVRVFVRRYVVHTDAGSNTSNISMEDFVKQRTGWLATESSMPLLLAWAAEERASMSKVAKAFADSRAASSGRAAAHTTGGAGAAGGGTDGAGAGGAATVGDDRTGRMPLPDAGRVVFAESGFASRTVYASICHLILAITTLLYAASTLTSTSSPAVTPFMTTLSTWIAVAGCSQLALAAATGIHGLRMRVPCSPLFPVVRGIVLMSAVCLLAVSAAVVSVVAYEQRDFIANTNLITEYRVQVLPCGPRFYEDVRGTVVPIAVMMYVGGLAMLVDLRLFVKFFSILRGLGFSMFSSS